MDKSYSEYQEFWDYLSQTQKDLIYEGDYLLNDIVKNCKFCFKDYSFLIFPFAKAYEGYLKQIFLDVKFINHLDYISDHFRLGKMMSPNLEGRLEDRSLYRRMREVSGEELADMVWQTWKVGRNQIFHYFPHNLKGVTFEDADKIISRILQTMQDLFRALHPHIKKLLAEQASSVSR